jgi:hypothetical protein
LRPRPPAPGQNLAFVTAKATVTAELSDPLPFAENSIIETQVNVIKAKK